MVEKEYGLFLLERAKENEYGELLIRELDIPTEDYTEVKYIYNTEEEQMKHREVMESLGYKCYQCGAEGFYRDFDKVSNPSSTFFRNDVRVPTSVFGINKNGLLHEARLKYGYYEKD